MNKKEKSLPSTSINWYPGHMAKTKKLIAEKQKLIDIVYELVDARIPFSSKISDIDSLIKNKPRIMIMTKKDLCDLEETIKWKNYYEELGYKTLIVDLNNTNDYKEIINLTHSITKSIQIEREKKGLKSKEIRALVIGIPNVGKSTLINKLAGKKIATVGNAPGVTKNLSWLKTNVGILLLDTPGVLWPKFETEEIGLNLASMTAIKSEILPIDDVAVHIINKLIEFYPSILLERYGITDYSDIEDIYERISYKNGARKNGEVLYEKVSNIIVNDIKNEYIRGITFDRR